MRRIGSLIIAAAALLGASLPAFAQQQSTYKIPRRVYFTPAVVAKSISDRTLEQIPDFIYTAISALQPIVRVDSAAHANSVIRVSVSSPGPTIVVQLLEKGVEKAKVSFVAANFADLARNVDKTAAGLAPKLGMVEPVVENAGGRSLATGNQALVQKVQLADRFARPIELSLEGSSLYRTVGGTTGALQFTPTPVFLQFAYYTSRSFGLQASLLSYYGTNLSFGSSNNSTIGPVARTFLLLPGIGVKYRTLGTLFASFSGTLYAGYGYVTAISSTQPLGRSTSTVFQTFLNTGASASIFDMLFRVATDFGYNISPKFAVHLGFALNISFPIGVPLGGDFFFQYLTAGMSYHP